MGGRPLWVRRRGSLWALDFSGRHAANASLDRVRPRIEADFRELNLESVPQLAASPGLPNPESVVRRLKSGRRCFIARVKEHIAAFGWVSLGVECVGEMEREIHLQPGEAYIWDCLTLPAFRRQGLFSALLSYINECLCEDSLQRTWIGSDLDNRPSLRGFAKAGFQPVIVVTYVRLGPLRCTWTRGFPEAAPGLIAAARRNFGAAQGPAWGSLKVTTTSPDPLPACEQLDSE